MNSQKLAAILNEHVPEAAYPYCFNLWRHYQFEFKLRKARATKVGDFTFVPGKVPLITVNRDLDPFLFVITYVHEIAHLEVHQTYGRRVESHGKEWKKAFQQLMHPITNEQVFPPSILNGLQKHMVNPMASTFSDTRFTDILRKHDVRQKDVVLLSQIPEGAVFGFRGKWFRKGKLRRTRVECKEIKSRISYLVPADVPIENAQLSLL
ncbi:MAG: sprT domain-containing protein [Cyclobacteriaceae bacterium]